MVEDGSSIRQAARRLGVSPASAHRWWRRWCEASREERFSLRCLEDRSSRPRRSPRRLARREEQRICEVRERTGWGPRLIAGAVGYPHSTVHRVLRRHGSSRRPRPAREQVVRYEWSAPGELLHMDTKRYGRFCQPGHALTGDRSRQSRGAGWEWAHSIVDDHSRLAYSEVLDSERAEAVVAFTARALDFFAAHGVEVKRIMTDNAFAYTKSNKFKRLLRRRKIKHKRTRSRRPQTNGKVERYQQTMAREWAYGRRYETSGERRAALSDWLRYYNERRPHSGIGDRPPISRVHNVSG